MTERDYEECLARISLRKQKEIREAEIKAGLAGRRADRLRAEAIEREFGPAASVATAFCHGGSTGRIYSAGAAFAACQRLAGGE
jgi:hypothetical protein